MPGRPEPTISGATAICSRSSKPCSRKADTVKPPPSTKIPNQPRECNRSTTTRRSRRRPRHGTPMISTPIRPGLSRQCLVADQRGRRRPVPEHAAPGGEPAARIENHPRRVGAGDSSGGQLRIVAFHGVGPDHDGIAQRSHPVQVGQVFRAVDVAGHPFQRGDAAVQALSQMRHRQRPGATGQRHRQIKIEQFGDRFGDRNPGGPRTVGGDFEQGGSPVGRNDARLASRIETQAEAVGQRLRQPGAAAQFQQ